MPPADPPGTDPADRDPREGELARRSRNPVAGPWLILGLILLLGAFVYFASAYFI